METYQKEVEKDLRQEASDHAALLHDFRLVLNTKQGQNVVWHILGMTCLYTDIPAMPMGERIIGRREIGLELLRLLEELGPDTYPQMIIEQSRTV